MALVPLTPAFAPFVVHLYGGTSVSMQIVANRETTALSPSSSTICFRSSLFILVPNSINLVYPLVTLKSPLKNPKLSTPQGEPKGVLILHLGESPILFSQRRR